MIAEVTQGSKPVLGAKVINIIMIMIIIVATMMININITIAIKGFLERLWQRWRDLKELQSSSP